MATPAPTVVTPVADAPLPKSDSSEKAKDKDKDKVKDKQSIRTSGAFGGLFQGISDAVATTKRKVTREKSHKDKKGKPKKEKKEKKLHGLGSPTLRLKSVAPQLQNFFAETLRSVSKPKLFSTASRSELGVFANITDTPVNDEIPLPPKSTDRGFIRLRMVYNMPKRDTPGWLTVKVIQAANCSYENAYVKLYLAEDKGRKTRTLKKASNFIWNETFKMYELISEVPVAYANNSKQLDIVIQMWHERVRSDIFIGQVAFVADRFGHGKVSEEWYELENIKADAALEQKIRASIYLSEIRQSKRRELNKAEKRADIRAKKIARCAAERARYAALGWGYAISASQRIGFFDDHFFYLIPTLMLLLCLILSILWYDW